MTNKLLVDTTDNMYTVILLIDPQNDFCIPSGSLFVNGAVEDCRKIADFICKNQNFINQIYVTMDCHSAYNIAHPIFWKDSHGNTPAPFTGITYTDYKAKKFVPVDEMLIERVDMYIRELERLGRYNLILWPMHCLKGSVGMAIEQRVWNALHEWECSNRTMRVNYITKGDNPYTEHYSALQAEIPDPNDNSTSMNFTLISELKKADKIIIAGEALSHCVANTVRDIIQYIPPASITLLTDCSSSVCGFENTGQIFLDDMRALGMNCIESSKVIL